VHKPLLAVVVADVAVDGEFQFERRTIGTSPDQLRGLADWFITQEVEVVVMEATAQYWRPVWETLGRHMQPPRRLAANAGPWSGTLHLAQRGGEVVAGLHEGARDVVLRHVQSCGTRPMWIVPWKHVKPSGAPTQPVVPGIV
jgi:hypothetical protein